MHYIVNLWPLWLVWSVVGFVFLILHRERQKRLKAQFIVTTTAAAGCLTTCYMVATIIACFLTLISLVLRIFWHL